MEEYLFLNEKEDDVLQEHLRRILIQSHPNPERVGCPDSRIIRDLAFRRRSAPENIQKVISHLLKCSECVSDALDYVREYEESKQTTVK